MKKIYGLAVLLIFLLFPNVISAKDPDESIYGKEEFHGSHCYYISPEENIFTEREIYFRYDGRGDGALDVTYHTTDSSYFLVELYDDIDKNAFKYSCPTELKLYTAFYIDYVDQFNNALGEKVVYYISLNEAPKNEFGVPVINNKQLETLQSLTLSSSRIIPKSETDPGSGNVNNNLFCSINYVGGRG